MSWSHHREPAPGRANWLLSGTSTKVVAVIAVIFVTGLSLGVGASWLLSSPANSPRTAAETSPPPTTAQATNNSENAADPCEGQTWPYVDDKCRAQLAEKSKANRQVRVISTDKSAPSTIVSTPAPPPQTRPVETATRETVGQSPAEAPRPESAAPAPAQASPPPSASPAPALEGQQTANTRPAEPAPPKASTPQPAATASKTQSPATPAAPSTTSTASPPPASTASTAPASTANTPQPESNDSAPRDTKAAENDNNRAKRSKGADRNRDRQNRTARRSAPPPDDNRDVGARDGSGGRDPSSATVRTYQMDGGGRVTVYQRGPTMQVGDRVDFGDSPPRSRRRAVTERTERGSRYGSRDDDVPVERVESRGFGEFFFGR